MIDQFDIDKLKSWLSRAKIEGTDAIKIVVGDTPNTWVVRTFPPKYTYVGSVVGHLRSATRNIQEIARAKCNKCGTTFPFVPKKLNSTKTGQDGIYPRCPVCNSHTETVVVKET